MISEYGKIGFMNIIKKVVDVYTKSKQQAGLTTGLDLSLTSVS